MLGIYDLIAGREMNRVTPAVTRGFVLIYLHEGSAELIYSQLILTGVHDSSTCGFVCLLVCFFSSHSRIFHSYGDVTITDEVLQILTNARLS